MKTVKEILLGIVVSIICFVSFVLVLHIRAYAAPVEPETVEAIQAHEYSEIFQYATEDDYRALEQVVFWESAVADCDFKVNKAVVETVCNRVLDPKWPNTIYQVCHQKGQFYCKPIKHATDAQMEAISDAIAETVNGGRSVLPSTKYQYFSRYKQKYATDYIWIGDIRADGSPIIGKGMQFGKAKS